MGLFKRGKPEGEAPDDVLAPDAALDDTSSEDLPSDDPQPDGSRAMTRDHGPWDRAEVRDLSDYLDLGSIWLRGVPGMELRLEVNEQEQQITGVTAVLGESAVQLQAFAAPRTEGVWVDIRNEIAGTIADAGGTAEVVSGEFGEELQTRMPQAGADGRTVFVPARFIGVDGPRWFLRAVVSGRAAIEPAAAGPVHDVVHSLVIDRGGEAMPPRELLPIRLPETATTQPPADAAGPPSMADLNPFERGPEITEVR